MGQGGKEKFSGGWGESQALVGGIGWEIKPCGEGEVDKYPVLGYFGKIFQEVGYSHLTNNPTCAVICMCVCIYLCR